MEIQNRAKGIKYPEWWQNQHDAEVGRYSKVYNQVHNVGPHDPNLGSFGARPAGVPAAAEDLFRYGNYANTEENMELPPPMSSFAYSSGNSAVAVRGRDSASQNTPMTYFGPPA